MKFLPLFLLLALLTFSSVTATSPPYPPHRYGCSNRCYRWRPRSCGPHCRPRRTYCRIAVTRRRCRYVHRRHRWGSSKKKVCERVRQFRSRRAWRCRPRFSRPGPRPPFGGCADKCKPYWSQAHRGCDRRYCHLKRCAVPWPRSQVRKFGWGCFSAGYKPPVVPYKPPYKPPVVPYKPPYAPPPVVAPELDPFDSCFGGCRPYDKAKLGCNPTYCAIRLCAKGKYSCIPKLPVTMSPSPTPSPKASVSPAVAASASPSPAAAASQSPTPSPSPSPASPCERVCYKKELESTVRSNCNTTSCRLVRCVAKGKGFEGYGCIGKA